LLPLYQLAFKSKRKKLLDAASLTKLFQITQLDLSGRVTVLPESIGQLHHLQVLNCYRNRLQALPESIDQLQNLQTLWCSGNQLVALPESIGQLRNLQKLYCQNNQL